MDQPDGCDRDSSGGEVYTTSVSLGLLSGSSVSDSTVIIDTAASANLVGVKWLNNPNATLRSLGRPPAKHKEALASFRYGDGRVGDVHNAAVIPIAIAGYTGQFMAYAVDADIPALLGKQALETLGSLLNSRQRVLTLEKLGADIPLKMNAVGRYILNVADFPDPTCVKASEGRINCHGKRVQNSTSTARSDCFFPMDVTSEIKMYPAGRDGPSPTPSCLETKQVVEGGLHPGGKISPSLRMDGVRSKPIRKNGWS